MTDAAIRWTKFYHVAAEAYEEGTLAEEDIISVLGSKERFDLLNEMEKQMAESGARIASVALATLDGLKKDDPPLSVLRGFVSRHYHLLRMLGEEAEEKDLAFMKNIEAYAKNDPELARMLDE